MRKASRFSDERFLKNIRINLNGCWDWIASKNRGGYGNFTSGIIIGAHRYSYRLFNGPLIKDFCIDHICRNRSCVNPDHLRQVTFSINSIENSNSTAFYNSTRTHCPQGHIYSNLNLINSKKGNRLCKICNRYKRAKWYSINKDKYNDNRRNKRKLERDNRVPK